MPDDARTLTYDDLGRALEPVLRGQTDIALDVKRLVLDHVTKQDVAALRSEMREGFANADTRYTLRELSDLRYQELSKRIDDVDERLKAHEKADEQRDFQNRERGFALGNNVVTWSIAIIMLAATLGSLVVSVIALTHPH